MRFTKIKANTKKVELIWTTPNLGGGEVTHKLESEDTPSPEFLTAMQAFRSDVLELLELDEFYGEGLTVIGLSINYEESGRMGLVVTSLKALAATNAPLVLNTPHLRESDGEEDGAFIPSTMLRKLKVIQERATGYVKGERAQGTLFPDAPESEIESVAFSSDDRALTLTR